MVETGKVVSIDRQKNIAKVRFSRKSSCASCGMCMFKEQDAYVDMDVKNVLSAESGDEVEIELSSMTVLKSALIAYLIPVLLAAVGLAIGLIFKNELIQLACCLGMLIIGYIIVILVDKRFRLTKKLQPTMLKILPLAQTSGDKI